MEGGLERRVLEQRRKRQRVHWSASQRYPCPRSGTESAETAGPTGANGQRCDLLVDTRVSEWGTTWEENSKSIWGEYVIQLLGIGPRSQKLILKCRKQRNWSFLYPLSLSTETSAKHKIEKSRTVLGGAYSQPWSPGPCSIPRQSKES